MNEDLEGLTKEQLIAEVMRLREGIREHRDSTGGVRRCLSAGPVIVSGPGR
jgi:hypothetical protein